MWRISVSLLIFSSLAVSFLAVSSFGESEATCSGIVPSRYRYDKISITDFGGVGDGRTVNTKAFRAAIYRIQHLRRRGGTLLYIPPGVYLTESFSLTSHMTLFLARGAVIKAVQVNFNFLRVFFITCDFGLLKFPLVCLLVANFGFYEINWNGYVDLKFRIWTSNSITIQYNKCFGDWSLSAFWNWVRWSTVRTQYCEWLIMAATDRKIFQCSNSSKYRY